MAYLVDQKSTGIDVVPALTPGTITNLDVQKQLALNIVGELTRWTFSFTLTSDIPQNGIIEIIYPELAAYQRDGLNVLATD